MPIRRIFLDWQQPALTSAAAWLMHGHRRGRCVDLRNAVIVVPGKRAGRRLLEVLVAECAEQKLILNPPQITTEGSFPEQLYTPRQPFANRLTQQAAWARALAETPAELRARIAPYLTAGDRRRQLQLGEMLRKQHAELAADGLDFADVARKGAELEDFDEADRWEAMAKVQRKYHDILDQYKLWDVQSARLEAVKRREPRTDCDIFLLGTVDLNQTLRNMLDVVADRVTALICAPVSVADRFDTHGCLLPAEWAEAPIPLRDEQLFRADGPADQAAEAARLIADLKGERRADEITLGVADERLVPQLQRQLHECGVPTRWVIGTPLAETAPFRFLAAVGEFAADREFATFAALARHPDVYELLQDAVSTKDSWLAASKLLTTLDDYYAAHLPTRLPAEDKDWHGDEEKHRSLKLAAVALDKLLEPLLKSDQLKSLNDWATAVRETFTALYSRRQLDVHRPSDRIVIDACREIEAVLQSFALVPAGLQPPLSFRDVLPLILEPLGVEAIPPAAMPEAVEILGWLELALDDAPVLIVTTFNEGFIPESRGADAFLPNRLREHLKLIDNQRRYARDAYAVQAILGSRPDAKFIVGRRDAERNPLAPSRLLFATEPDKVVARARRFFRDLPATKGRRVPLSRIPPPVRSRFDVPRSVAPEKKLEAIRVTQFKSYLACKYRFYLQHLLQLKEYSDAAEELEPGLFGDLVHDVLQDFGRAEGINTCDDEKVVLGYLEERLDNRVGGRFGRGRRGAINLQVEQIRSRLKAFARWQAQRAGAGWQIAYTEDFEKRLEAPFAVDEATIKLRGRIDRIDWHPKSRTLQVLDYKTADNADHPAKAHRDRDGLWKDLQLPLYRHLIGAIELVNVTADRTLEFGYIQLPKDPSKMGLVCAEWGAHDLDDADSTAREVIRGIWNGEFDPPVDPPPEYSETFAAICQDRLLDRIKPELLPEFDDA